LGGGKPLPGILRIAVVLHSPLIDLINESPGTIGRPVARPEQRPAKSVKRLVTARAGPTSNYEIGSATSIERTTYIVDFAPVFFICCCARDTGEVTQKPFGNAVNGINRWFSHDLATARSDIKVKKESLTVTISGASTPL
jgi:hypothetical protein